MASIKRIGKDSLGVPIWDVIYRRTPGGKQVHRRIHAHARADVEREILLDSERSGIGIRWSEAGKVYLSAKAIAGVSPASMENVTRALAHFARIMGDPAVEDTTAANFKRFMQELAESPSGPKVANECRVKLLTIARYLRAHTGKIVVIPFEHVPPLPIKVSPREPIPTEKVNVYLEALPSHVRRPVLLILYYGLRSSAVCNITSTDVDDVSLSALDKGKVHRRIPLEDMLSGIVADAVAHREAVGARTDALFVTMKGTAWDHRSLNHAAQKAWRRAGLPRKKIHEVRHTLGTVAGKFFSPGMVQAAMGHRSRKSAEAYFHPSEEMAAEVRKKIVTELSQKCVKTIDNEVLKMVVNDEKTGILTCPCCGSKLLFPKGKGRKP